MSDAASQPSMTDRVLQAAAGLAAKTWPIAARIFPEGPDIDSNQSLWAAQTPDYQAGQPLKGTITCDLAIIGGGFTGTSTAYHFSRRYPEKRVVLLEAKSLANGASGRNGGMMLNWVTGVTDHSPEMTQRIYKTTSAGIQMILEIIQRHNLKVSHRTDGTLTFYTDRKRAEDAHKECEEHQAIGIPSTFIDPATLAKQLNASGVYGAVLDPGSGQINGAQLVRGLRPVLVEQGVEIYENTPVLKICEGSTITLTTPQGEVQAKAIVLGTNGYTTRLGYFRDALFPLHSHVFATASLTPEQREEIGWRAYAGYSDDYDRISYSTLTNEGNIVFGGGSNQSYAYLFNNRTAYPGTPQSAGASFRKMESTMHDYLPASKRLPITHRWTGTLGITLRRNNLMGVRGDNRNVFYAIGYCGHGVTLANVAGAVLTDMYSGDDQQWRGLPFYHATYSPIPPEPFRWFGYQTFTRLTGKSPRV
ncbi:MAG: FAD-binding oxidoreductase [Chloroflexi bacterium]|nr:FAD-binding oxidoreductase [Chloroflexota bacterium]MCC6896621.1 FAD-dependent oxidoreductase [Anaerolineae bacterium]